MRNNSRQASTASQVRRSSRAASRKASVISILGTRSGSRRESNDDHFANFNFDDPNIDWNDPAWNSILDMGDDVDPNFQIQAVSSQNLDGIDPQNIGHNAQDFVVNSFNDNPSFDLGPHSEAARASLNLLQNPFSALPSTSRGMAFEQAYAAYAPTLFSIPPQMELYPQYYQRNLLNTHLQSSGITNAVCGPTGDAYSAAANRSASGTRAELPIQATIFNDAFAGYVDDGSQVYRYPDPIDTRFYNPLSGPYYGHPQYQLGEEIKGKDESFVVPDPRSSERRPLSFQYTDGERGRKRARRSTNESESSRSTYPDRSRSDSVGSKKAGQQVRKRKSVFGDQYTYETPQADPGKSWIRTNGTTKGLTTRTAKCNHYVPTNYYTYTEHPLRDGWSTRKNHFKYTADGEWAEKTMSTEQIRDFILNYPQADNDGNKTKLLLYVQVGPTDSARRYLSPSWTKCRFRDCPANVNQTGTILHGHYRVAFDERSFATGNQYDPHLAASAYVHLYCMERFLDLEWLCRKANVDVDTRHFPTEPKTKFAASFLGRPEQSLVEQFIDAAREDEGVRKLEEYKEYPAHDRSESRAGSGEPKKHDNTLTCRMHEAKADTRPPAQLNQFHERGLKTTHLLVNKGDLEVMFRGVVHKKKSEANRAKNRKRKIEEAAEDDEDEDLDYRRKKHQMLAEARHTYTLQPRRAPRRSPGGKVPKMPKVPMSTQEKEPWNVDDDESDEDYNARQPGTPGSRRSRRTANNRINYREDAEILQQHQQPRPHQPSRGAPLGYEAASGHALQYLPANQDMFQPGFFEPQLHQPSERTPTRRRASFPQSDLVPAIYNPQAQAFDFEGYFDSQNLGGHLNRRSSRASRLSGSTRSGSSILREPSSRYGSFGKRASFAQQPVSQQQTFDSEAPPNDVVADNLARRTRNGRKQNVLRVKGIGHKVTKAKNRKT